MAVGSTTTGGMRRDGKDEQRHSRAAARPDSMQPNEEHMTGPLPEAEGNLTDALKEDLLQQVKSMSNTLLTYVSHTTSLQKQVENQQAEIEALQAQCEAHQTDYDKLKMENDKESKRKKMYKSDRDKYFDECRALKGQLNAEPTSLKGLLSGAEQIISDSTQEAGTIQQQKDNQAKSLSEAKEHFEVTRNQHEQEKKRMREERGKAQEREKKAANELESLQNVHAKLVLSSDQVMDENTDLKDEIALLKANIRDETESAAKVSQRLCELMSKHDEFDQSKKLLDEEIERVKRDNALMTEESSASSAELEILQGINSSLEEHYSAAQKQLHECKDQLERVTRAKNEHLSTLHQKNTEIDDLRNDIAEQNKAWSEVCKVVEQLRNKVALQEDELIENTRLLQEIRHRTKTWDVEATYARLLRESAYLEDDEYATASIWAVTQDCLRAAYGREHKLRKDLDIVTHLLRTKETEAVKVETATAQRIARLDSDKARIDGKNQELDQTNTQLVDKIVNHETAAKASKSQLTKLRKELKDFKAQNETQKFEAIGLEVRCKDIEAQIANVIKERDTLRDEKKDLLMRVGVLVGERDASRKAVEDQQAQGESIRSGLQSRLDDAIKDKEALDNEKKDLLAQVEVLEGERDASKEEAKTQVAGIKSELDAVRAENTCSQKQQPAIAIPQTIKYARRDDRDDVFVKSSSVPAWTREIYNDGRSRRLELRVDGKILPHGFIPMEQSADEEVDAEAGSEAPLLESSTTQDVEILSNMPWSLTTIDLPSPEKETDSTEDPEACQTANEDSGNEPTSDRSMHEEGEIRDEIPAASTVEQEVLVQDIAGTVAPTHEVGQDESRETELAANPAQVVGNVQDKVADSPLTLKGPGMQRISIEIPKRRQDVNAHSLPTPAHSEHRSPRDAVASTPRSPLEEDSSPPKKTNKRPAPQDNPAHHRSPKRQAPFDPTRHAPKQPRRFNARKEQQDIYRPVYDDRPRRLSAGDRDSERDPYRHDSESGMHRHDSVREPHGRDIQQYDRSDAQRERERERNETQKCYGRRW